ncbi:uncharacterized protein C8R40DRAFT_792183 [Lentinula edodes]|uniref:uncharacterized protein n=1 Tax=Lentinula edodes TaxID=5353 RepID=UPI001E8CD90E|nr:uncharacterized protein C8R40DRAFT_792183 [Lentinula edodes]KAH7869027.1 hypothetical protein C8R40DRAFT_792183 [Lentinula edodes]
MQLPSLGSILPLEPGILSVALLLSCVAVFAYRRKPAGYLPARSSVRDTSISEKNKLKEREWGEWPPVTFSYPPVTPTSNPVNLKPIPYRPFRWGAYHVTMGIRDMPWDEWIETDYQMQSYYYIKKHRIATRGTNVVQILPDRPGVVKSASQGAIELVHELADYLSKRYPDAFTVSRNVSGDISSVAIIPVNAKLDIPPALATQGSLKLRQVSIEEAERAMKVSALLVQDDLALMVEGTDGRYYFQGGAICVPGFWRMRDKIGLPLEDIHIQGHVPQYETRLHNSMDRYFKRMPVEKPIIRNNYFFQVIPPEDIRHPLNAAAQSSAKPIIENDSTVDPEELAWSTTTNGFEETFNHGHPITPDVRPTVAAENLRLRTERQTLRRLPLSGAIVFGIRTYLFPVEELAKEPGIPARMASAMRSWPEDVRKYKGNGLYEKVMLEYLDKAAKEQLEVGGEELMKDTGKGYPF